MKLNKIKVEIAIFSLFVTSSVLAAGSGSYEVGVAADASGAKSVAVGDGALAGGASSQSVLGSGTTGTAGTVGDGKYYTDQYSTAIGYGAKAQYGYQENPAFEEGGTAFQYYGGSEATAIGSRTMATLGGTAIGAQATATGRDSVAVGKEASATGYKSITVGEDSASRSAFSTVVGNGATVGDVDGNGDYIANTGINSSAFGVDAAVIGNDSLALGARANVSANNSVALGADSVASRANTVSVGHAGAERTISNVAAGIYSTDAVNLRQLENVEKKLSSGIAAAMAFTVPTIAPGKSNGIAIGAANYNGASAMSLNLAHKFTDEIIATAGVAKGFNSASTARGHNDDIGVKASVSWSF